MALSRSSQPELPESPFRKTGAILSFVKRVAVMRKTGELAWKSSASFKLLLKEDETKAGLARIAEDMGPGAKKHKAR
jgi:hypothetical protein